TGPVSALLVAVLYPVPLHLDGPVRLALAGRADRLCPRLCPRSREARAGFRPHGADQSCPSRRGLGRRGARLPLTVGEIRRAAFEEGGDALAIVRAAEALAE